jgi:RNA polymerase sigma-70 factor (ECF subfamily)
VTGTDEDRLVAAGAGDLEAFRELVLAHQRSAWGLAFRFLQDAAEAEDVAQEAFLRILEAAPRYRPTASFRTYLCRVVTRLCIDRSEKKHPEYTDEVPDLADPAPGPEESLATREREERVRDALGALPANQRAALILRHHEGLSYVEVADALATTTKAVEGLLGRARATLQDLLAGLECR